MENILKVTNCDTNTFNKECKKAFGSYPNQLPKGSIINLVIGGIRGNIDKFTKIYLDLSYIAYKNGVKFNILTTKGFVPLDYKFMISLYRKLGTKVLNIEIPYRYMEYGFGKVKQINFPVFKGQLITLKNIVNHVNSYEIMKYMKTSSCYRGDFKSFCNKEDNGAEQCTIRVSDSIDLKIVINFKSELMINNTITKDCVINTIKYNAKNIYFALNKQIFKLPEIKVDRISENQMRKRLSELVDYLFGFDDEIFYTTTREYTLEGVEYLAKEVFNNLNTDLFIKSSYDEEDFRENLEYFLQIITLSKTRSQILDKEVKEINDNKYRWLISVTVEKIVNDMRNLDKFVEVDTLYEDSYNEEDSYENNYLD